MVAPAARDTGQRRTAASNSDGGNLKAAMLHRDSGSHSDTALNQQSDQRTSAAHHKQYDGEEGDGESDNDENDYVDGDEENSEEQDDDDDGDDEEVDDDEDDEDDEDESEGAEEENAEEEIAGFDEQFLAQLMAMDKMFVNKGPQTTAPGTFGQQISTGALDPNQGNAISKTDLLYGLNGLAQPTHRALHTSNSPSFIPSASTPSNEFYDGAINFLTEVLGSSNPNIFASAGTPSQGWTPSYANATPASPAPPMPNFKNLQPLISNLIARLKGQPVEDTVQAHRISEEDLVVLLQSLMTQRQNQLLRKTQNEALTTNSHEGASSVPGAGLQTGNQGLLSSIDALEPQQNPPHEQGFSIVDFDFGDDDDDPDFVPPNLNLDYGNSVEFAEALASVANNPNPTSVSMQPAQNGENVADAECWQRVLDEFAPKATQAPEQVPSDTRSRSTMAHVDHIDASSAQQSASPTRAQSKETEDGSGNMSDNNSKRGTKGKRKTLSKEEALARRRQVNRDCARRQRERKKHEAEELRLEIERLERNRAQGIPIDEDALSTALPLLQSRKPGRPLGSKNRHAGDDKSSAEPQVDMEEMLDLRADNRMLRAEMQRLTEENAHLRARLMRYDDLFNPAVDTDLRKRKRKGAYSDYDYDAEDMEKRLQAEIASKRDEAAARFLAYNPFREHLPEPLASRYGKHFKRSDRHEQDEDNDSEDRRGDRRRGTSAEHSIADVAAELVSNPKAVERLVETLKQQSRNGESSRQSSRVADLDEGRNGLREWEQPERLYPPEQSRMHGSRAAKAGRRHEHKNASLQDLLRAAAVSGAELGH